MPKASAPELLQRNLAACHPATCAISQSIGRGNYHDRFRLFREERVCPITRCESWAPTTWGTKSKLAIQSDLTKSRDADRAMLQVPLFLTCCSRDLPTECRRFILNRRQLRHAQASRIWRSDRRWMISLSAMVTFDPKRDKEPWGACDCKAVQRCCGRRWLLCRVVI